MKVCEYCGRTVSDSVSTCPYCQAYDFKTVCDVCGTTYDGPFCPACAKAQAEAQAGAERALREQAAAYAANQGLGWKTILTIFLPFIGGWFLLRKHVMVGFKVFATIWCLLFAIVSLTTLDTVGERIVMALLCAAPVVTYLVLSLRKTPK